MESPFEILSQIGQLSRQFAASNGLPQMLVLFIVTSITFLIAMFAVVFGARWIFRLCRWVLTKTIGEERTNQFGGLLICVLLLAWVAFVLWGWAQQLSPKDMAKCRDEPESCFYR